jgi:hypothetical protein
VWLQLAHPEVAERSCDDCRRFRYNDSARGFGAKMLRRDSRGRMTLPQLREWNEKPPCGVCPKIPWVDGKPHPDPRPEHAVELGPVEWRVYLHYLGRKATGFPPEERDNPWVAEHAGIIRAVEDQFYSGGSKELGQKLDSFFSVLLKLMAR